MHAVAKTVWRTALSMAVASFVQWLLLVAAWIQSAS
jgi:hypothetical protein